MLRLNVYHKTERRVLYEIDVDAQVYHTVIAEEMGREEGTDHGM